MAQNRSALGIMTSCSGIAIALLLSVVAAGGIARADLNGNAGLEPDVAAAPSDIARRVLQQVRPAIIQVKGFFGANTGEAFHGTGFAVGEGGLFATNYHVVAEWVHEPDKYRLEYRTPENKTGAIDVLAIDVANDLALVRASGHAPEPLTLATGPSRKGIQAFAVGYPLDLGLTITQGVSNGDVEDAFTRRIHYSGALNGGMSGGPAVDARGDIIGVNVSAYVFSQLVSFLVPSEKVAALIARAPDAPPAPVALQAAVAGQMGAHGADLMARLTGPLTTELTLGYRLPARLASFIDCNADGDVEDDQPSRTTRIACSAKAGVYVRNGLSGGDVSYNHTVLSTQKLDAWRFYRQLSSMTGMAGRFGQRRHVGPYACKRGQLALKGFSADVVTCARAYRKLTGLFDFSVRVVSLDRPRVALVSQLDLYAIGFEGGHDFIRRYLGALEWTQ